RDFHVTGVQTCALPIFSEHCHTQKQEQKTHVMTTTSWNEGYFTDAGYTYGYYREINPVFQRFCLLAAGFAAPEPSAAAVHCELEIGRASCRARVSCAGA